MLTYHNDPELKKAIVEEMNNHRTADQFIKGSYKEWDGTTFKGCAVGCAIDSFNKKLGKKYSNDDHAVFEDAIGVPEWLARLQDTIFEGLPNNESSQFAVDLLEAIPVGVKIDAVKWKFTAFILKENIERVLLLENISELLKKQVVDSIRGCLSLYESGIEDNNFVFDESAAELAAWSAAWSAESAARSAAESSAYQRYANELLRLLRECK